MIERIIHMIISFVGLGILYVGTGPPESWVSTTILVSANLLAGLALVICAGTWIVYLNNKYIEHKQAPIRLSKSNKFMITWDVIVGFGATAVFFVHGHVLTSLNCLFAQLVIVSLVVKYTKKPTKRVSKVERNCSAKASRLKSMLSKK